MNKNIDIEARVWILSSFVISLTLGKYLNLFVPPFVCKGRTMTLVLKGFSVKYIRYLTYIVHIQLAFSSVQSLSRVRLFATQWIAASQDSLSITNSRSSLRLMSIKSVMPSSHLIFCRLLLLLCPIPPSIRVFSNESTLCMRWPKYWNFSLSIIPSKEIPGLISFRMDKGPSSQGSSN